MEKKNYLYLAPSKLRNCAIGPELVIAGVYRISGNSKCTRTRKEIWSSEIQTGEKNMAHIGKSRVSSFQISVITVIPLQAHVHFFGADAFSFGDGIKLETAMMMQVHWEGMGRALE